jgi:hypothetical protein
VAMMVATMPSIRSVLLSLAGLRKQRAQLPTAASGVPAS